MFVRTTPLLLLAASLVACDPADTPSSLEDDAGGKSDASGTETANERASMVHLFNWRFADVEAEMSRLAAIGYTHVLVSPPNLSAHHEQWWGRYQPLDYRVIDGPLGDRDEFESMIASAERHGLRIVVDVVFNHMANLQADDPSFDLTYPPPDALAPYEQLYRDRYGIELDGPVFTAEDFHEAACIDWASHDTMDPAEVQADVRDNRLCGGETDPGLPDLLQSEYVQQVQRSYLEMLAQMGVGGYRFDAIKHMEPDYAARLLAPSTLPDSPIVFGEIIAGAPEWDRDIAPYWDAAPSFYKFYDFPLVKTALRAFGPEGSLSELAEDLVADHRAMPSQRAITFVVNHDIPQNGFIFGDMLFGGNKGDETHPGDYGDPRIERLASAFVLGRAGGIPLVYADAGRSETADIKSDAYRDAHCDDSTVRMLRFRRALVEADERPLHADDDVLAFGRGDAAFVVINKGERAVNLSDTLDLYGWQDGTYVDALTGSTVKVVDGRIKGGIELAAVDAAMFVEAEFAAKQGLLDDLQAAVCKRSATAALWSGR